MKLKTRVRALIVKYNLINYIPLTEAEIRELIPFAKINAKLVFLQQLIEYDIRSVQDITNRGRVQLMTEHPIERRYLNGLSEFSSAGWCIWLPLHTYEQEWIIVKI